MKNSTKAAAERQEAAAPDAKRCRPRWFASVIRYLERGERRLSIRQKKILLLCFTLVTGACFLHLAITGAISQEVDSFQPARTKPPNVSRMPLPQALSTDSLQNKSLLP